jgi:hypothetical protein
LEFLVIKTVGAVTMELQLASSRVDFAEKPVPRIRSIKFSEPRRMHFLLFYISIQGSSLFQD